jgi:hypothetical protein
VVKKTGFYGRFGTESWPQHALFPVTVPKLRTISHGWDTASEHGLPRFPCGGVLAHGLGGETTHQRWPRPLPHGRAHERPRAHGLQPRGRASFHIGTLFAPMCLTWTSQAQHADTTPLIRVRGGVVRCCWTWRHDEMYGPARAGGGPDTCGSSAGKRCPHALVWGFSSPRQLQDSAMSLEGSAHHAPHGWPLIAVSLP